MHVRFGSARRCRSNINYAGFNRGKAYVNFKITVYWVGDVTSSDVSLHLSVLMTDHFSHQHRCSSGPCWPHLGLLVLIWGPILVVFGPLVGDSGLIFGAIFGSFLHRALYKKSAIFGHT